MKSVQRFPLFFLLICQLNSMAQIRKPGVFVQEVSSLPASVSEVASAIPAFIGYTEKADNKTTGDLRFTALRIKSFTEFEQYYGKSGPVWFSKIILDGSSTVKSAEPAANGYNLNQSVQLYFNNGGGPCYVVSIGNYSETFQRSAFLRGLDIISKQDEPTLLVMPEAINLTGNDLYSVQQQALQQAGRLGDRFCILDLKYATDTRSLSDMVTEFRTGIGMNQLTYGAAYTPFLKTPIPHKAYQYRYWKNALWTETGKISLPDLTPDPAIKQKITELDLLASVNDTGAEAKEAELLMLFPLMKGIEDKLKQAPLVLPPSGAVAGLYCNVDRTRGVWKAPANQSLSAVNGVAVTINDHEQESLNVDVSAGKSVNAIRSFTGRGINVWGSRTLAGNDNEWRYIPVRRFFIMVEESLKKSVERFVFEPNDANTWVKVKSMIENYLTLKWRDGALMGSKPEQAFYVKTGLGKTMTAQDVLEGRMIIEVGMAVVRPAEFIILKFSVKMAGK